MFGGDFNKREGYVILDHFKCVWSRTLYRTPESANAALREAGWRENEIKELFTIVPAKFDFQTVDFEPC